MQAKQVDFSKGSVTRNIIRVAAPMLVAQILNLMYNIVDRIYIGRIPGEGLLALGGVGLCFPFISLITAFTNLYGAGGAPLTPPVMERSCLYWVLALRAAASVAQPSTKAETTFSQLASLWSAAYTVRAEPTPFFHSSEGM